MLRSCALAAAISWISLTAFASPLSQQEIVSLCGNAEDPTHCGRLIEEVQLKRLPNLARRDGNALIVSLYPSGTATFKDSDDPIAGRSYSLWDFLDSINAVVLYSTAGDATTFILVRRTTERAHSICRRSRACRRTGSTSSPWTCVPTQCGNEIAVWRVAPESLRKELAWTPGRAVGGRCRDLEGWKHAGDRIQRRRR